MSVASGVVSLTWMLTSVDFVHVKMSRSEDPQSVEKKGKRIGQSDNIDLVPVGVLQFDDPQSVQIEDENLIYNDMNLESKVCGFLKCFFFIETR